MQRSNKRLEDRETAAPMDDMMVSDTKRRWMNRLTYLPFASLQDYERPTNLYKEQPPLRPPNMNFVTSSVQASVSPRFDSLLGRPNSKVADSWTVNNVESKTSDQWGSSYTQSQTQPKRSDVWSPTYTQSQNRRSELWSPSLIQAKIPEEPQTKTTTNTVTKTMDTTAFSQNSSNLPMLKRSGTEEHPCRERYDHHSVSLSSTETAPNPTCCPKWCSPRCKLGALGFVIGLLTVAIPLAVVLVLWLRQ